MSKARVLVTGGSGLVGSWVLYHLLKEGYTVRATVRSSKAEGLRQSFPDAGDRLEIVQIDDLRTGNFASACHGMDALVHVASPVPTPEHTAESLYNNTLQGLDNVMQGAISAGVKHVVYTSSRAALHGMQLIPTLFQQPPRILSEKDWGNESFEDFDIASVQDPTAMYVCIKTLAEKKFWKYAEQNPSMDFTSIVPEVVWGGWPPHYQFITSPTTNSSNMYLYRLITGEPGQGANSFPRWPFPQHVHGYDLARAHERALHLPPSNDGTIKRFVISQGPLTYLEAIRILKAERPELSARLPKEDDPIAAMHSTYELDLDFTERVLGLKREEYKPARETLLETIDQLVKWEHENGESI